MSFSTPSRPGGEIASIEAGGLAEQLGLRPGDRLLAINGHPLRDLIDYRYYLTEDEVTLDLWREERPLRLSLRKHPDADLGLTFVAPTFTDGLRTCNNNCGFCFVKQLPRGLRRTLYVKDDDYRYSFLFGDFITLTNLTEADWQRIAEQRLSPLYISVHATDPGLRRQLLGNPRAADVREQIARLGALGIQVHTQIVLVPPYNLGTPLEQSIHDLARLYPIVQSVAVVPVGLTDHHPYLKALQAAGGDPAAIPHQVPLRSLTRDETEAVLARCHAWQKTFRQEFGISFVYPSDELYLTAGQPLPPAGRYDGFPQVENGVGLARLFLDDWKRTRRRLTSNPPASRRRQEETERRGERGETRLTLAILTGVLFAPAMQRVADEVNALIAQGVRLPFRWLSVHPVANNFLGHRVTVAGLLTAEDVIAAGRECKGDVLALPRAMFDAEGRVTLDDKTADEITAAVGRPVRVAGWMSDLLTRD